MEEKGTEMRMDGTVRRFLKSKGWTEVFDGSFVTTMEGWCYEITVDDDGLYTLTNTDLQDVYDCSYDLKEMLSEYFL